MASDAFNGSYVEWTPSGGAKVTMNAKCRGIHFDNAPAVVDVSGSTSTTKISKTGRTKKTLTIDLVGPSGATIVLGGKGASNVVLNDTGTNGTFTNGIVTRIQCSGRVDAEITGSFSVRPTNA